MPSIEFGGNTSLLIFSVHACMIMIIIIYIEGQHCIVKKKNIRRIL